MKIFHIILLNILVLHFSSAQFVATEVGTLPESVSNNAVCEGFIDGVPYLFSFGGIDSTRLYSGIHLRSFRYNIETGISERIDDLPDDLGKIGVGASRIGDIIYIAGGYNVFANGSEKTTNKMHRYDVVNNQYLSDAKDIPVPTDDHVQTVWRDSLIYLITGWNDTANIPNVQIYNPLTDEWSIGTSTPNISTYKSFGASGIIVDDVIFYFGGATSNGNFHAQPFVRIGAINPSSPTEIDWSAYIPDSNVKGYRMAVTAIDNEIHWIGGSNNTYNFNGIAYDGSGVVSPNKRDLYLKTSELVWNQKTIEIPMDLRGIANVTKTLKYIAGGMLDNREVTNKVYRLEWQDPTSTLEELESNIINIGPNPFQNSLSISLEDKNISIQQIEGYDLNGSLIFSNFPKQNTFQIETEHLATGTYFLRIVAEGKTFIKKVIKSKK